MTDGVAWNDDPRIGERKESSTAVVLSDVFLLGLALLLLLANAVLSLVAYFTGAEGGTGEVSTSVLWATVAGNAFIFILLPVSWVFMTRHGGWRGVRRFLGMTGGWSDAAMGIGVGVVMVMVLGGIAYLLEQAGLTPESAPIEDLLRNITWPLAIAFSLVAGIGEEVLFRGILQRWLKWWGQGLLFGTLHIANAGIFAFTATAIIGLGFGYARHRGISLWTLIVAHFTYDLILLAVAIAFPDLADSGGTAGVLP